MFQKICAFYKHATNSLQKIDWLPALLARLSLGSIFITSGWGKLHSIPKVTGFFTELGIPFPEFNAHLVAFTEFSCGSLILLGLFTRLASLPLIATMVTAIVTAKRDNIGSIADLLGFEEFIYIALLVVLIVHGAGKISLDHVLKKSLQ